MTKAKQTNSKRVMPTPRRKTPTQHKSVGSKTELLVGLLSGAIGITIPDAARKLGWQAHSVRGVISGENGIRIRGTLNVSP